MDEILRAVNALQTTDKYKVSAPANWPKNELIGEDVIRPQSKIPFLAKVSRRGKWHETTVL